MSNAAVRPGGTRACHDSIAGGAHLGTGRDSAVRYISIIESGLGRLGLFNLALLDVEFLVAVLCLEDHSVHLSTEQQHGG